MTRHSRPVWQMVKEAVEELGSLDGTNSVQYVHDHYPQDSVKPETVRLQLIACSVNHPSAHHFADPNRFLWYEGNGHYRAYDPDTDKAEIVDRWRIIPLNRPPQKEHPTREVPFSRIEPGNRVVLPSAVAQQLELGPNDIVAFVEERGKFYIRKGRLKIEMD